MKKICRNCKSISLNMTAKIVNRFNGKAEPAMWCQRFGAWVLDENLLMKCCEFKELELPACIHCNGKTRFNTHSTYIWWIICMNSACKATGPISKTKEKAIERFLSVKKNRFQSNEPT